MRSYGIAVLACAACSFTRTNGTGETPDDAGLADAPGDAAVEQPDGMPDGPAPTVAVVQRVAVHPSFSSSGGTLSAQLPAPVAAGNTLAMFLTWNDAHSLNTVNDDQSNVWAGPQLIRDTANQQYMFFAHAPITASGTPTVTAVFNGAVQGRIFVLLEVSGRYDASASGQGDVGTAGDGASVGPIATAADHELVLAASTESIGVGTEVVSAGTGAMPVVALTAADVGGCAFVVESYGDVAAGGRTATFTYSANGHAMNTAASFRLP